ncbi:DUF5813 family protein [Natronobiforma cellulositropha]|uniref:DUF5813 family protein n=1 Tax=Natronobiforma cellulositropha TaxID=1679076 RepID=UPI0021D5CE15|nr:DUF5813 family protein [Natronobiforma cellulositropha]
MTETSLPDAVERALDAHEAFERVDDGYALSTSVFETTVTATPADEPKDGRVRVSVTLPTLDAAVEGETVAPVVEDGWFETLERRLVDVFTVAKTETYEAPVVERTGRTVTVVLTYDAWDAKTGVADAKALAEFVEGTFAQGIIPGYTYRGPARELLENAQSRGQ